ncbi:MAG: molybdopterin molybdenumtransferase MoeA [Gammaproteobacteria bacterium]|nr:molybdopterin molybdenumtransferase MoeA [Gammaproteobacteria bacterium]
MVKRDASCDDDYDPNSLSCEAALAHILEHVSPVTGYERVHLRAALGRVLGESLHSPFAVPAHTNSAMDGYALSADSLPTSGTGHVRVIGSAFAGRPFNGEVGAGKAVRIMTGAAMPPGTDTVVMQEHVAVEGQRVALDGQHKRWQNVRQAGEDLKPGQQVFERGRRLLPPDLGLIASLGIGEVTVQRRVRVAYFSTGDELRSIGEQLGPGEIFDSNRYTLYAMLKRSEVEIIDMGVVRDKREAVEAALRDASQLADVVITSGGVSVGEADYIKEVLASIGEVRFWKVAMKPGRPLAFGALGPARFFGLPGNPVSVMVTFYQFVQPALFKMAGTTPTPPLLIKARSTGVLKKRPGRMEFQRGILSRDASGQLCVTATGDQGSGILNSMASGDCFIILGVDTARVEAGTLVDVQPFQGLL